MTKEPHHTAAYKVIRDGGGVRFRFFCESSGAALCTTKPVPQGTPEEMLRCAWETEGRAFFNQCHRCGRWVSNVMYNPDTLECVDCSPWEEQPEFCPQCGTKVERDNVFCPHCSVRLRYGGEEDGNAGDRHP